MFRFLSESPHASGIAAGKPAENPDDPPSGNYGKREGFDSNRSDDDSTCRLSSADSDRVEPALGTNEQLGALDDAHFLGPADSSALQHGEGGGYGVAQRFWRV